MSLHDSSAFGRPSALETLPQLFDAIAGAQDADEILALALDALAIALRTERVAIVLFDDRGARRCRARGLTDAARRALERDAFDLAGGSPRLVPDLTLDPELAPHAGELLHDRVRALAVFPIERAGRRRGRIAAAHERPRDFSDAECAAALAVAHATSSALDRHALPAEPATGAAIVDPEARFRMLLDSAPDAVVTVDHEGRIVLVNARTERMFGWSREELLGQPVERLMPAGYRAEHVLQREDYVAEPRTRPMALDLDLRGVRKDGTEFPVEIGLNPMRSAEGLLVTAVIRDISDRVRLEEERATLLRQQVAQAEIEKSHRRALYLAEVTRALTSSFDIAANLRELARLSVPQLADGCVVDLVSDDGSVQRVAAAHVDARKESLLRELLKTGAGDPDSSAPERDVEAPSSALRAYLPDPEQVRLIHDIGSVMVIPLVAGGRTLGMMTCFRIRSGAYGPEDLDFAQDLARRTAAAIENARLFEQAREANRLKDEFLTTLSHELRTPLNAILGWAHLLKSGELDAEKTARAIEIIERNAKSQSQLIGDILDFSRITVGNLRLSVSRVELDGLLERVVADTRPAAEARGIRIESTLEPGATVFGDPARLSQIVRNLISNAIKFSDRGGFVHLDARRDGETARIVVRDQGAGIPHELLPHVFDRFRRNEASLGPRREGLGLGLAIARHLVELHGGQLAAESEGDGHGASFTVTLPIRSAAAAELALLGSAAGEAPERAAELDLSDLRVVAVDDESDARQLLETLLESRGARVWTAASAAEALAVIPEVLPDILLVDIGMAVEDGYSLMRKLRARPAAEGGQVPSIALTAFARDEDRRRAIEAGCQLHVAKPVEPDLLLRAIRQLVPLERDRIASPRPAEGAPVPGI